MKQPTETIRRDLRGCAIALAWLVPLCVLPLAQAAPTCPESAKLEIINQLAEAANLSDEEMLQKEAQIYAQCAECAKDDPVNTGIATGARYCGATVKYQGSVWYEDMVCCGYDPQRCTFACPVRIKRNYGFGPAPLPGSREYVLNCVADAAGV